MISYGIFATHILFLSLLALLLHYQHTRIGLTPMLFFLASLIVILNFADLMEIQLEPFPGFVLRTGGHVYVPIILMTVLVLYIANGTSRAQLVLFALTGINVLVLVTIGFMIAYINLRDADTVLSALVNVDDVFTPSFVRGVSASLVAFVADVFMIAIVRQGLRNLFKVPDWFSVGLALIVALWVDSIVFQILFNIGTPNFVTLLPGDIVGKSLAALLIWPVLGVYLVWFAPQLPDYQGKTERPTFDMLFGIFGNMNSAMQKLQAELKTSQEIYTQLTENIREVFWLADMNEDRIVYLSPAFEKITGYAPEYFYDNSQWLRGVIHPEDQITSGHKLLASLDDPGQEVFRIRHSDGNIRWLRNRAFPITTEEGVSRYAGILEDVTVQEEIKRRDQMIASTESQVRVLNDFIRDASHDLKNPLSAILLKVGLLERLGDRNPEKRAEVLQELKGLVQFQTDLIDDLFTLSRVQGNDIITMQALDMNHLVRGALYNAQAQAEMKGLGLEVRLAQGNTRVLGNEKQMRRVVNNLIQNAIRYTERGTVRVTTDLEAGKVVFRVQDTGIGIAAEDLPFIFERFYRSEKAKAVQHEGTGLGLAISKAIVEYCGGRISASSEPGVGSIFTVTLPPHARDIQEDTETPNPRDS